MYEIAEQVQGWLDDHRVVQVAQVVATRGFSSRDPAEAMAWVDGMPAVGSLLSGLDPGTLTGDNYQVGCITEVTITEDEAVAAGLACGGVASVLVQPASAYPADVWTRLAAREPLCLVTEVRGEIAGRTELFTPATIRDAHFDDQVPRIFGSGTSMATVIEGDDVRTVVATLWPVPTLIVVGDGLIAQALGAVAGLLGWRSRAIFTVDEAAEVAATLSRSDAFVVLSHDRAVDGPSLAAALTGGAGYVGGLGSRNTQAARRAWLAQHGVSDETQARIHGPAGLDIDAHTPGEIAISIVAEILASRAGSSGGALRERPGPVHIAGVSAPPPRGAMPNGQAGDH